MARGIRVEIVEERPVVYIGRVQYADGRVEEISNVSKEIFEWLYEELDEERSKKTLYFQRTDGGTALSRAGVTRIDVVRQESKV